MRSKLLHSVEQLFENYQSLQQLKIKLFRSILNRQINKNLLKQGMMKRHMEIYRNLL
jgi:hypothetical protein